MQVQCAIFWFLPDYFFFASLKLLSFYHTDKIQQDTPSYAITIFSKTLYHLVHHDKSMAPGFISAQCQAQLHADAF